MAEKFKAKITGITLSAKQLEQAKRKAAKKKLDKLVNFEKMDFNKTAFQNETFTKIFGLESICYAYDKLDFLKEAHRILKVGGKIVVADGFLSKRQLTEEEEDIIYKKCLLGWKVDNLSHQNDFFNYLRTAGFKNIKFYDKKKCALPTSEIIAYRGYLLFPLSYILSKFKVISKNIHENSVAFINQKKAFNSFTIYGVFEAEK